MVPVFQNHTKEILEIGIDIELKEFKLSLRGHDELLIQLKFRQPKGP